MLCKINENKSRGRQSTLTLNAVEWFVNKNVNELFKTIKMVKYEGLTINVCYQIWYLERDTEGKKRNVYKLCTCI